MKSLFLAFAAIGWLFNGWFLFDAWLQHAPVEPFISWMLIVLCGCAFVQMLAEAVSHALR